MNVFVFIGAHLWLILVARLCELCALCGLKTAFSSFRHSSFPLLLLASLSLLSPGCHFPKPAPLPPKPISQTTPKGPASIIINPYTEWSAAPARVGTPLYTNRDDTITDLPASLDRTIVIQRRAGLDFGYLAGQVKVPMDATLYIALPSISTPAITDGQLQSFTTEGWQLLPGPLKITQPEESPTTWHIYAHQIPAGPITLTSDALPLGGIFFIGRAKSL